MQTEKRCTRRVLTAQRMLSSPLLQPGSKQSLSSGRLVSPENRESGFDLVLSWVPPADFCPLPWMDGRAEGVLS